MLKATGGQAYDLRIAVLKLAKSNYSAFGYVSIW